jgi:hypothetical protein
MAKEIMTKGETVTETSSQLADMRNNEQGDLRMALARAVAARKVPDDAIAAVAKKLASSKYKIRAIDTCIYGICIDYFFDTDQWYRALPELARGRDARVHGIEVFPWGIPWPDIYRVRVQQEFDEMAPFNPNVNPGLGGTMGAGNIPVTRG